jgi:hypothetical protein
LLAQGAVATIGEPTHVLSEYLYGSTTSGLVVFNDTMRKTPASDAVRLISFALDNPASLIAGQPFAATLRIRVDEPVRGIVFGIGFNAENGQRLLSCASDFNGDGEFAFTEPGEYAMEVLIPALPLWPCRYVLDAGCRTRSGQMLDGIEGFEIIEVLADEGMPHVGLGTYPTAWFPSSWRLTIDAHELA